MRITNTVSVQELKNFFHNRFPYLKIELYTQKHEPYQGSSNHIKVTEDVMIQELAPEIIPGNLDLNPEMTVEKFESIMEELFGLHVQVFRKSGDQWFQTTISDGWTLGKQEKDAEEIENFQTSESLDK